MMGVKNAGGEDLTKMEQLQEDRISRRRSSLIPVRQASRVGQRLVVSFD